MVALKRVGKGLGCFYARLAMMQNLTCIPSFPGQRWEEWEARMENLAGYGMPRNNSAASLATRAVHADFACVIGRYAFAERSMFMIHEKSKPSMTAANMAYLHLTLGLDFPSS